MQATAALVRDWIRTMWCNEWMSEMCGSMWPKAAWLDSNKQPVDAGHVRPWSIVGVAPHVFTCVSVCYRLCRAGSPLVHQALRDGSTAVLSGCRGSRERSDGWRIETLLTLSGRVEILNRQIRSPLMVVDRFGSGKVDSRTKWHTT